MTNNLSNLNIQMHSENELFVFTFNKKVNVNWGWYITIKTGVIWGGAAPSRGRNRKKPALIDLMWLIWCFKTKSGWLWALGRLCFLPDVRPSPACPASHRAGKSTWQLWDAGGSWNASRKGTQQVAQFSVSSVLWLKSSCSPSCSQHTRGSWWRWSSWWP